MCNGGPGCDDYLGDVASMIENTCQVVRFEPRGCGRSDYDGNYDLETSISDIEFIRKHYGFEKVLLIGHSYGPDVALAYSLSYPANTLGIIGIAGGRIVNDRSWSDTYHRNLESKGEIQPKVYESDPEVNRLGNISWLQFINRPTLLSEISQIDFPVSYISAGADIRPNWPTEQLANLIAEGSYTVIPSAPHCIWLTHAEELKQALNTAVSRVTRPKG